MFVPGDAAHADIDTSDEAAQAIIDARTRANRAAEELATAEAASSVLTDQLAVIQADVDATSAQLSALTTGVENLALSRFVGTDSSGLSLLNGLSGPTEQVEADVLAQVANNAVVGSIDEFESVRKRLAEQQTVLDAKRLTLVQNAETLEVMRGRAEDEIAAFSELEQELLQRRGRSARSRRQAG